MPDKNLEQFIAKVKQNPSLQGKLKAAADRDAFVAIAKDAGYEIDYETIDQELTPDQLKSVSGGGFFSDQFDLIVDYWLGDTIKDIQHSLGRIEEQTGNGAGSASVAPTEDGKGCTDRELPI